MSVCSRFAHVRGSRLTPRGGLACAQLAAVLPSPGHGDQLDPHDFALAHQPSGERVAWTRHREPLPLSDRRFKEFLAAWQQVASRPPSSAAIAADFRTKLPDFARDNGAVPQRVPIAQRCRGLCQRQADPALVRLFNAMAKHWTPLLVARGGPGAWRLKDLQVLLTFEVQVVDSAGADVVYSRHAFCQDHMGPGVAGVTSSSEIFLEVVVVDSSAEASEGVLHMAMKQHSHIHSVLGGTYKTHLACSGGAAHLCLRIV